MALYSRLFKYAPLPDRTPLENFLTESFCDCLERMTVLDRKSAERFVMEALVGTDAPSEFRRRLSAAKELCWKTQQSLILDENRGYFDLCLLADSRIILAIENKVGAGFTSHSISRETQEGADSESDEDISQLDFYGEWLSKYCPGSGLLLLTHLTEAPSTFLLCGSSGSIESRVFHRVRRWAEVCRSISCWQEHAVDLYEGNPQGIFLRVLMNEFLQFLEERNMTSTETTRGDLDVLQAYFQHDILRKVRDLLAAARPLVFPALPELNKPRRASEPDVGAWEQTQIIWDWVYCYDLALRWYVGWGFSGQHGLRHLDIDFANPLQAFALMTSEVSEIPATPEELRSYADSGWTVFERNSKHQLRLLKVADPHVFNEATDGVNASFQTWVAAAVRDGLALLRNAHRRLEQDSSNP